MISARDGAEHSSRGVSTHWSHSIDASTAARWLAAFARAGAMWHPFLPAAMWRARTHERGGDQARQLHPYPHDHGRPESDSRPSAMSPTAAGTVRSPASARSRAAPSRAGSGCVVRARDHGQRARTWPAATKIEKIPTPPRAMIRTRPRRAPAPSTSGNTEWSRAAGDRSLGVTVPASTPITVATKRGGTGRSSAKGRTETTPWGLHPGGASGRRGGRPGHRRSPRRARTWRGRAPRPGPPARQA